MGVRERYGPQGERFRNSSILFPSSIQQLHFLCQQNTDIGEGFRLTPGSLMGNALESINGFYGLQLIHPRTGAAIARCGFSVINDTMEIAHTPQGADSHFDIPGHPPRHFRQEMMDAMIEIAVRTGLKRIEGVGSANHFKVRRGEITPERGKLIIDDVFHDAGFDPMPNGNWELQLL